MIYDILDVLETAVPYILVWTVEYGRRSWLGSGSQPVRKELVVSVSLSGGGVRCEVLTGGYLEP